MTFSGPLVHNIRFLLLQLTFSNLFIFVQVLCRLSFIHHMHFKMALTCHLFAVSLIFSIEETLFFFLNWFLCLRLREEKACTKPSKVFLQVDLYQNRIVSNIHLWFVVLVSFPCCFLVAKTTFNSFPNFQ